MAVRFRRLGAALALSLAIGAPAVFAQGAPAGDSRAWVDPPTRAAASPEAPKTAKAPITSPITVPTPKKTVARAAPPRPHADIARRQAPRRRVAAVAPRRALGEVRQRQRIAVRSNPIARPATARRFYGYAGQPLAYGRFPDAYEDFGEDFRARRIRQAQESGYLVVRQRTVAFPDGRRLRSYQPYESVDDD